jgi:hypothetical protein
LNDYVAGLLASDGSARVHYIKKKEEFRYYTGIELAEKQILEDISNMLNIPLGYRKRIINNKEREFYKINIPVEYVGEYGKYILEQRKGVYDYYKNCNKNDFIRGYFDGNGSVSYHPKSPKNLRIGFSINSGHIDIKMIIDDFCKEKGLHESIYLDKRGVGTYYISINSKLDVLSFYNYIYENNPFLYLKRKYNIFIKYEFPSKIIKGDDNL